MYCGIENNQHIHTILNSEIKIVDNLLRYLGSWMQSTEKAFNIRKALSWSAANKMKKLRILRNLEYSGLRLKQYIHMVLKYGQLQNQ